MESLEYYQLKDTLSNELREQIDNGITKERNLQQQYIGLGVKIAIVGLGAAVIAISIFGIKSAYDINTAIKSIPIRINERVDKEIVARFNKDNPVVSYEEMLRESATRAIAASISVQATAPGRTSVVLDERTSAFISDALGSPSLKQATKLTLISALSTSRIRSISPTIDQNALVVLTDLSTAHLVDERSLTQAMRYFSFRNPSRFAADIEGVYKTHKDLPKVQTETAKYLSKLEKDSGQNLASLLGTSDNQFAKVLLHIRNIKIGKESELNSTIFKPAIDDALNDRDNAPTLDDLINYMTDLRDDDHVKNSGEIIGSFLDLLQGAASAKGLTMVAGNFLIQDDEFFGLAPKHGARVEISHDRFDDLFNMSVDHIIDLETKASGEFNEKVRKALDFWLPKALIGDEVLSKRVGFLSVQRTGQTRFAAEGGKQLSADEIGDPSIISVEEINGTSKVVLKWKDRAGKVMSIPVTRTTSDPAAFVGFGTWRAQTDNDVL